MTRPTACAHDEEVDQAMSHPSVARSRDCHLFLRAASVRHSEKFNSL